MKQLWKQVAALIALGPAVYLLGHLYLYSADVGAGHWLGPWATHTGTIMAVGAAGLGMVVLATLSLAPLVCLYALDWRSSRELAEGGRLRVFEGLSVALGQTPPRRATPRPDPSRHRAEWGAWLFGIPSLVCLSSMIGGLPISTAIALGAMTALAALGGLSVRLRRGVFPAPQFDLVLLSLAQLSGVVLSGYLYVSIRGWLLTWELRESLSEPVIALGLSVLCTTFVAWFMLPATRAAAQRRLLVVGCGIALLSLLPTHALRIITTSLAYTSGGQSHGVLVAKADAFAVPNACPASGCRQLNDVRLIADLGETYVFWYLVPTQDGYHTMQRAAVSADTVHFEVRERPALALSDWALFR